MKKFYQKHLTAVMGFIISLVSLVASQVFSQTPKLQIDLTYVSTIAGTFNPGYADGIGTAASFTYPYDLTAGPLGDLYVSNHGVQTNPNNNGIRKITIPGLVVTTPAGAGGFAPHPGAPNDGTGTDAEFYDPRDVVSDAVGNVYVMDNSLYIRKMTPEGVVTTILNVYEYFFNDAIFLQGLAIDRISGYLYASIHKPGNFTNAILNVSLGIIVYQGTDYRAAPYFTMNKFVVDGQGNFIFYNQNKIQKLTPAGAISTIAGTGNNGSGGDGGPALSADLSGTTDVEVDALNNIYVLGNNRIRKVSPGGFITAVAGYDGFPNGGHVDGNALVARFVGPTGIIMNADQTALYIADPGNSGFDCKIRKVAAPIIAPFATITSYASTAQYYSVSGAYLSANATITAPVGYEVSLSESSGYASSLSFTPQNGDVPSRNIYVRLAAATSPGTYNGNIVFSSSGATSALMPVTGVVAPHQQGGAFNFDGGGYTYIPQNNFPLGNSNYTIEAWVKSSEDRNNGIIKWGGANIGGGNFANNSVNGLALYPGNKIINYWWANDLIVDAPDVNNGNWHHIAATYDGTTRKIYMDGVLLGSDNATGHNVAENQAYLGGLSYNQWNFKGTLDELRVFNKALTQSEIIGKMNCELPNGTDGLSAYYKFNQGTAFENNTSITGFTDASGNGNNSNLWYGYSLNGSTSNFVTGAIVNDVICGVVITNTWYRDADGDGWGRTNNPRVSVTKPNGFVDKVGDCNDGDATIYLNAPEQPDGKDNNCNGQVDEGLGCRITWYKDIDGDGRGRTNLPKQSCIQPSGHVDNATDCNDGDASIYSGAPELCDGKDNNCNGVKDEGCAMMSSVEILTKGNIAYEDVSSNYDLQVNVWPNPAKDVLNVSLDAFSSNKMVEMKLIQMDGKQVSSKSLIPAVKGQQVMFDVRTMSTGYYILQIKQGAYIQAKKVIIVR